MPSPVGHALGGAIVGLAVTPRRRLTAACAVAACLPDLDFLWGRHNLETHSIGFALVVGIVVWAWSRAPRLAMACTLAVGTHVLFDWLGSDTTPPLGVLALWPFSQQFYFADAFIFEAISRRYWLPNFVQHNLRAVGQEIVLLGPIVALMWWFRRRAGSRTLP